MSDLNEHIQRELDSAFRHVLRAHGVKGMLFRLVGDLIDVTAKVMQQERLTTEQVAAAIERDGGFIRVGMADAFIDGHHVCAEQLVNALLHRHRNACPQCQTKLDEHGYCTDAGCVNVGKVPS